ncbi:MAG TPA: amino acid adenylation domain-containing protein [Chthoniobacterales bacterium]
MNEDVAGRLRLKLGEQLSLPLTAADDGTAFLELGLDSVIATEFIEFIRREFAPELRVSVLFDHPTIAALARQVVEHIKARTVAAEFADEVRPAISPDYRPVAPVAVSAETERCPEVFTLPLPIAVVGMSGRFPGADNLADFWRNLAEGVCSITGVPAERSRYWQPSGLNSTVNAVPRRGGFLRDIERFDPLFFGISPKEAAAMDPQQRLFLEEAWRALEDAAYAGGDLSGCRCGVYAGIMNTDYQDLLIQANAFTPDVYELMGSAGSMLAARIAYHLNLRGPAITVDTSCSSGLVAVHLACRALQQGEIDLALAGGVTLYLTERRFRLMGDAGMLAGSGQCRPFDDAADGMVPGETAAVIVLKRLPDAVAEHDAIYGIIQASGMGHSGKTNGITAPSSNSQQELITRVHRQAGVTAHPPQYIEAHGTGTKLGDPIEAEALARAFANITPPPPGIRLGTVKANIGHAAAAAGLAGLIKVLLALRAQVIPPQIGFSTLNRHIDLTGTPLLINTAPAPWNRMPDVPRRAAVSAFGFSGTNAHVVVQEAPAPELQAECGVDGGFWIVLSARTEEALGRKAADLRHWCDAPGQSTSLVDLSFTLSTGRTAFEERLAFRVRRLEEVRAGLLQFLNRHDTPFEMFRGRVLPGTHRAADGKELGLSWVAGQDVNWRELYRGLAPRKLHLPVYPFAGENYWYDTLQSPSRPAKKDGSRPADLPVQPPSDAFPDTSQRVRLKPLLHNASQAASGRPDGSKSSRPVNLVAVGDASTEPAVQTPFEPACTGLPPSGLVESASAMKVRLRKVVADALFLRETQLSDDSRLVDLGLDSIVAVEIAKGISAEFGVSVPAARLYDHPSLQQLLEYVHATVRAGPGEAPVANTPPLSLASPADSTNPVSADTIPIGSGLPGLRHLTARIRSHLARTLFLEEHKIGESRFADLGLDSILAVNLIKELNAEFATNLSAATVHRYPTTRELARHLQQTLAATRADLPVEAPSDDAPVRPLPTGSGAAPSLAASDPPVERLRVLIARSGAVDDLQVVPATERNLGAHEIRIAVEAASVMLADLLCVSGLYPTLPAYPFTPGFEVAGTVEAVGADIRGFQLGDRVFGMTGANLGGHAATAQVEAQYVAPIPEALDFEQACALPVPFLTANHALFEVGRLRGGETVLIHSAGSCTGQMAVQLARRAGARVVATVGSVDKIARVHQLGAEQVFNYRSPDVWAELRASPLAGKVNVVLNLLSGSLRDQPLALLASGGRFLDLAVAGLRLAPPFDFSALAENRGYFGIDCRRLALQQPSWVGEGLQKLIAMLAAGEVKPLPVTDRFSLRDAPAAYRLLESRTPFGRIVLLPRAQGATDKGRGTVRPSVHTHARPEPTPGYPPIAVVGFAGRFPGAPDPEALWRNLAAGRMSNTGVPAERRSWRGFAAGENGMGDADRQGGFLDAIARFDAAFFRVARPEAEMMDPQHRLFLQEAWRAIEDAGYSSLELANRACGIFVGVGPADYYAGIPEPDEHSLIGNLSSGLTARLAYHLNWTGPCLAVDTACASSFTALHLACASLHRGECDLALVGGVNVAASSKVFAATKRMGLLALSGRCRTFDAEADGWVIGEAVAAIVLKPLETAERDGDHIRGVIRFSGMNQDGAKNGLTAPSAAAQSALQRGIYEQSGINPETVDLIEIHGTSSRLGDEIEVTALKDTFAQFTSKTQFCALGSLKPNIGHPIAAAGVTCLIKVLLALQHQKIPPVAGLESVNPALQLDRSPFLLNTELLTWKGQGTRPRRAAINGLSATGTNCHLIVDEYVAFPGGQGTIREASVSVLLVLSARQEAALRTSASNLLRFFQENPGVPLRDVAFTLQVGREAMAERLALVVASPAEAKARLSEFLQDTTADGYFRGRAAGSDETFSPLLSGAEGNDFFSALIRNRSYEKLARLWTRGVAVDWRLLYQTEVPRRVPLPTYPFSGEDYWHPGIAGPAKPADGPPFAGKNGDAHPPRREPGRPAGIEPLPSGSLLEALRASVAEVLRTEPAEIRADDDLARHGFGSLYVLRVVETFERLTGVRTPVRLFFEERTLRRISAKLVPASGPSNGSPKPEAAADAGDQPAALPDTFPLTEAQRAVWSTQMSFPGSTAYHLPLAVLWNGRLDVDRLRLVLGRIAADQPALRTTFQSDAHGVMQVVHPSLPLDVQYRRVEGAAAQAIDAIHELSTPPFDLDHGPLWRACVLSGDGDRDVLFLHIHHLVFDGRSLELLLSEIERRYGATADSWQRRVPERTLTGFAELERGYLASDRSREDHAFWLKEFPDGFAPFRAAAAPEPSRPEPGRLFHANISKRLIHDLEALAVNRRVTLQAVFLTAFQVVLAQAAAAEEVVTGIAVDARPSTEFAQTIGFFVNVLPIRLRIEAGTPFQSLLAQTFDRVIATLEHRQFPLRRVVQTLSEIGKPAVLPSAFYFQTWQTPEHCEFADRLLPQVHQTGEFDLVFEVMQSPGDWHLHVKYRPAAFADRDAEHLAVKYLGLLETICAQPEIRPGPLQPRAAAAPETLEVDQPTARAEASNHSCVHHLIDEQACLTPEPAAVIFRGQELTYQALQQRTNQLAHHLLKLGVTRGSPVGVCVDRSLEMLVSLIAVWKAGAPYVPLDPTHPDERLAFVTRDSGMTHLITRAESRFRPPGVQLLDLDANAEDIQRCPTDSPDLPGSSEDLAYVIYTSGSTGQPKGVQIRQRSLRNFLLSMAQQPGCTSKDYVLAATTVCFDIAALEFFLPLITGARVEILPEETVKGGVRFREKVERSGATLVQGTPSTWRMLLAADLGAVPGLKILCGGEPWDQKLAGELLKRGAEVWNMYGPTETTVWSAIQKVQPNQPIRLGEPIANTRFYVLDPSMKPVPSGEIGELWIGGDGLAKGYVNRPDLTRDRFVPDPARAGELIYKTGDLVRYV